MTRIRLPLPIPPLALQAANPTVAMGGADAPVRAAAPRGLTRRHSLRLSAMGALAAAAVLSGCATMQSLAVQVQRFGTWPAGRAPGRYAFDRLPSQQAQPEVQALVEQAAADALATAGFMPAPAGAAPDVLVQVGARIDAATPEWQDPLWWRGSLGPWRSRPWVGSVWHARSFAEPPRYAREVALLVRDRASGQPLIEVRASSEGYSSDAAVLMRPMFRAALQDFPATEPAQRLVHVPY